MPVDAQLDQLRGAGCAKIYREKVTGARADRRIQFRQRKQEHGIRRHMPGPDGHQCGTEWVDGGIARRVQER
jgi:hypothetical protein